MSAGTRADWDFQIASYYEEVLVVRVHPDILRAEALAPELVNDEGIWEERYHSIRELESHLHRNGTTDPEVLPPPSKEEQRLAVSCPVKRTGQELEVQPRRSWRARALERNTWPPTSSVLRETSTKESPWFAIPADDKKNARLLIAEAILTALKDLKMSLSAPGQRTAQGTRSHPETASKGEQPA